MKLSILLVGSIILASSLYASSSNISNSNEFNGKNWVILCSGSKTWYNYAHGSNIYHMYQLFRARGIPDEQIIVLHYDDLATHPRNPTPGQVINTPTGPNVYVDVPKHYTGNDVNPENFLKVLKGDKELESRGKRVLKSGPNDHVFVVFNDHGGPGLVMFPNDPLHNTELIGALKYMHQNNMYSKLVFYLDACESGSMFAKLLPDNLNIYAVSSSAPDQDSYFWYMEKKFDSVPLSAWFIINFINHTTNNDMSTVTLDRQYQYFVDTSDIVDPTQGMTKEHPGHQDSKRYGDLSIGKLTADQFFGKLKHNISYQPIEFNNNNNNNNVIEHAKHIDLPIYLAEQRLIDANTNSDKLRYVAKLESLLNGRQLIDNSFVNYVKQVIHLLSSTSVESIVNNKLEIKNNDQNRHCYRQLVNTFHRKCFNLNQNPYVLKKLQIFVNICNSISNSIDSEIIDKQLQNYCLEDQEFTTVTDIE
ncbi:legumain-like [Oppia nitens]|uniref:legumain-like n=1 Tax=Oppia nitens TaxID=1686743 RepID=UPI0023DB0869|nr:legumain-like [Oppia nitens]